MKNKLLKNILSSGLQAVAVQILGVVFFYLLSVYMSKEGFGYVGWANAVCMFVVTILSFGMEQVVVRRIAASRTSHWAAASYLFHTIFFSSVAIGILCLMRLFIGERSIYNLLPIFFLAQAFVFMATPLKQFLNAKERFAPYAIIALISNSGKVLVVFVLLHFKMLSVSSVALTLIAFGIVEFVALLVYLLSVKSLEFTIKFKFSAYKKLLKESFPQFMSVIFDSSLSRVDWILLGILSTTAVTADYSFAYRAYELAKLPLVILGPVILVRYSKLLVSNMLSDKKVYETSRFLSVEIFVSVLILLVANIGWSPVIDSLTRGKYGYSNSLIFLVISLCLPLQFAINLFWTIGFSTRSYRAVARITFITAIVNLLCNVILIPRLGGLGAALAYLASNLVQAGSYYRLIRRLRYGISIVALMLLPVLGAAAFAVSALITQTIVLQIFLAVTLFLVLSIVFRQIKKSDIHILASYLKK